MTETAGSTPLPYAPADRHAAYDKRRIFIISLLALATAGVAASVRANIADILKTQFLDPIDPVHSAGMLGSVLGVPFLGFALTIMIGSPLLDLLGMGRLLGLSSLCFIVGTIATILTPQLSHSVNAFLVLRGSMLITGIGWGLVETVVNPLCVTLYPDDKTHKLNVLHAWWPGGLVIGGLLAAGMSQAHIDWRLQLALVLIPASVFGGMMLTCKFPPTERVAAGVSYGGMVKGCLVPMFFLFFLSMFLTAASELAPGQWVNFALSQTVHMPGILLLVYVSGLMFVFRHFAGPIAHKFSPIGLLWVSCLLASLGLVALSVANSPVTGLLSATLWGTGVCFMWPTMLGSVSERFPRGGAVAIGLMGTAGMLSIWYVLPEMGKIYDHYRLHGGDAYGAQMSFRVVAALPALLLLVFGAVWLYDKSKGGFKPVKLSEELGQPYPVEL